MTRFEKWSVWLTSVATAVTGVIYLWMKYFLTPTEPWAVVNHPWQPWVLKAHIVVAPLLVFAIGLITMRHIWRHFRTGMRRGRRSGLTTALVTGPMVATGYLIQVLTGEGWVKAMAISHIAVGVIYALGLVLHQAMIRRSLPAATPTRPRNRWAQRPRATSVDIAS